MHSLTTYTDPLSTKHTQAGSKSKELLDTIARTWYLVSVTDNSYTTGGVLPSFLG